MNAILGRIFTKPFIITIIRYALAALGAWLASNYGFDPGNWEVIAGAVLTIVMALWGGADSVTDKVVLDGTRRTMTTPQGKAAAERAVNTEEANRIGRAD